MRWLACVVLSVVAWAGLVQHAEAALDVKAWYGEEPMTPERILEDLVEYFSQRDPHGIPVLKIPNTIEIPDKVAASQITLWDLKISGHKDIRLEYINLNVTTFTGVVRLSVPWMNVAGEYEWPGWWSTSAGSANITMTEIQAAGNLELDVTKEGLLVAQTVDITLNYGNLDMDFTGLAGEHSLLVGAADTFFSSIIQPLLVGGVQDLLRNTINRKLEEKLKERPFPNSISPVDFVVAKVRRDLRKQGMDPLVIDQKDINLSWGVSVQLKDIEVRGITTIHRTREVSAQFIDNAIFLTVQMGTQKVRAGTDWSVSAALLPAVGGHLDVEVESLEVTVMAKQPANIKSPPVLRDIDVKLGNIAVRSAGEGTLDYLVELLINIIPNTLRNVIMDRIEPKIHQAIQKRFNGLDLYRIILDQLAKMREQEAQES